MKNGLIPRSFWSRLGLILVLTVLSLQIAWSHKQTVHQYIVREAYSLLLKSYSDGIPGLSNSIGMADQSFAGDSAWQKGFVTTGAWREDDEDVVYHYDILPGMNYALTSITHFWSADRGDFVDNMIRLQIERPPLPALSTDIGPFPSAFTKMMKFAGGGWVLNYPRTILCRNTANNHWLVITPLGSQAGFGIPLSYRGLTSFYRDKKLSVHSNSLAACLVFDAADLRVIDLSSVTEIEVDNGVRDIIVWEILGRMCHLLADMSVPAHAHLDEHGLNPDSYEDYVGGPANLYRAWNADNAGPAILRSGTEFEVLHFLMYTMQQQPDHFGSNGPVNGNGNDNIAGDATEIERYCLATLNLSSLGGPTTDAGPWTTDQLNAIRDRTLPYAIRATAGLLYWFCVSTNLVTPITSVASERTESLPTLAHLDQNYPNPFNPTTGIRYHVSGVSEIRLVVCDLLGREVAVLVNEEKAPGSYEVRFDAAGFASGAYLYRLTAGNSVQTRKMVVVK